MISLSMWFAGSALANGLTTHVTISEYAIDELGSDDAADARLVEIVSRDDLWWIVQNGTQFPDGGYAMGEAYSETAHWEPFQDRYLEWIRTEYGGDYSSEAAKEHIAFLMGLASHGMGDQVFDALYMQRAYVYDAGSDWVNLSMDTSTDVAIAAITGGQTVQDTWIPYDQMVPLMADAGIAVSAETLAEGQNLTHIAIGFGIAGAGSEAMQAQHSTNFPWSYAHILDEDVPGSPPWEGRVVAKYWQVRWARLNGEKEAIEPVIYTFPPDGGFGHETDPALVESRVTLVFSRGLVSDLVSADMFTVTDTAGNNYPVTPWVFYGHGSHVVHLSSESGWPDDTDFVVTASADVPYIDGTYSETEHSFTFSTKDPPVEVEESPPEGEECGCAASGTDTGTAAAGFTALVLSYRRRERFSGRPGLRPAVPASGRFAPPA